MIKVNNKNAPRIEAMLAAVNGRSTRHTYVSFCDIFMLTQRSEKVLAGLEIPKKLRVGARFTCTSGYRVPNSYRWSRKSTEVELYRRATGWFMAYPAGVEIWTHSPADRIMLSEAQMDASRDAVCRKLHINVVLDGLEKAWMASWPTYAQRLAAKVAQEGA